MQNSELLTAKEASKMLKITPQTLRAWTNKGMLHPIYTVGGHRRFAMDEILGILRMTGEGKQVGRVVLAYCRVSTSGQKDDLERQVEAVSRYCEAKGYQYRIIRDIGSGMNYGKKGLVELVHAVCSGETDLVVVNYRDRIMRFGYELFEQMCKEHGVDIEVINHTENDQPNAELVEDVLSVITVYSAKLYGRGSHKNKQVVQECRKLFREDGNGEGN